ncbi:MAG: radical SAM protein [bacterium]|nr:radical SAM protein [bacterium]
MENTILLTPPISKSERFGSFTDAGAVMPGLGILSLAACLRKKKIPVSVLDAEGMGFDLETTVKRLVKMRPKILGITSTTLSFLSAAAVAAEVKKQLPDVVTVFGGPHVTAMPNETMKEHALIDAVIQGDGELSFTRLVENVHSGTALHCDVDGLLYRENGTILANPKTRHHQDLDSLPFPAWELLEGFPHIYRPPFHSYRKLPLTNIITARGCPCACSFCDRSVFGRKIFSHSIEYVTDMIEYLVRDFNIREISIKDDTFTTSTERVVRFSEILEKRNIKISWSCNARVNYINEEMLKAMKKSGCWLISYGIESGSPVMLKKMMKGISKKQVTKALQLTRKYGITSKGFFMVGIPGETKETVAETIDFIKDLPLDEMSINYFTPFPGSELYGEVIEEGFKPDFSRMNMQEIVYVPKTIEKDQLQASLKSIIYKFYLRPDKILRYLSRALKDYNEFQRVYRMGKTFLKLIFARGKK